MEMTGIARVDARQPPLSATVVAAIAEHEHVDPMDLDPPLFDVVDPDALDGLFNDTATNGRVTFTYRGADVTVTSEGDVRVSDSA